MILPDIRVYPTWFSSFWLESGWTGESDWQSMIETIHTSQNRTMSWSILNQSISRVQRLWFATTTICPKGTHLHWFDEHVGNSIRSAPRLPTVLVVISRILHLSLGLQQCLQQLPHISISSKFERNWWSNSHVLCNMGVAYLRHPATLFDQSISSVQFLSLFLGWNPTSVGNLTWSWKSYVRTTFLLVLYPLQWCPWELTFARPKCPSSLGCLIRSISALMSCHPEPIFSLPRWRKKVRWGGDKAMRCPWGRFKNNALIMIQK